MVVVLVGIQVLELVVLLVQQYMEQKEIMELPQVVLVGLVEHQQYHQVYRLGLELILVKVELVGLVQ
jgi:hypothetical protein